MDPALIKPILLLPLFCGISIRKNSKSPESFRKLQYFLYSLHPIFR